MITEGASYPINDIYKEDRLERLEQNLQRGNHPIRDEISIGKIKEFVQNEIDHGFLLLIPKDRVREIPGAEVYLIHIVK